MDKITKYELFRVPPRWLFLRLETADGVVGWGEPVVEGFDDVVAKTVEVMLDELIGEDPARINHVWQRLNKGKFYGGLGPVFNSAVSGIDQALWDIKGKTLGAPVHSLLGGAVRDRMLVYGWAGEDEWPPDQTAADAKLCVASGFRILKMNGCPRMEYVDTLGAVDKAVARMAAVREAVGSDIGIGLDFHGRCKLPMVRKLIRALEPYNPLFIEEPLVPEHNTVLPELVQFTPIPIATGERMFQFSEFARLLASRGASILQPDLSHAGGITHVRDIARLAEHHDVAIAPHCPLGPLTLASSLAIDFVSINAAFQETSMRIHYNQEGGADVLNYVVNKDVFQIDADGMVALPTRPGLGVEIDEEHVRAEAEKGHNWRDRSWFLPDGTPTRW